MKRFRALISIFACIFVLAAFTVQAVSALPTASTLLMLSPVFKVNIKGKTNGSLASLIHKDQSGSSDDPARYMLFTTPSTVYQGYRVYKVSPTIIPSITSLKIQVNFKGPDASSQTWSWYLYRWSVSKWVRIGTNSGFPANIWYTKTFTVPNPQNYISGKGSIRVALMSNNATGDAKLDYEVALISYEVKPQQVTFINQQNISLTGYLFKPSGKGPYVNGAFPAVVLMHGCSGVFSYSNPANGLASLYHEWGNRLVENGYAALLVDSFTPRNSTQNQCNNGSGGVSEITDRPYDALAGYAYLASQPFLSADHVGLLGWSPGGSATMVTMDKTNLNHVFKAAVAFYPGCGLYNAFGGLSKSTWLPYAPFRIHHGLADTTTSPEYCQQRVNRAVILGASPANGNPTDLILYAGAHHGFDNATSIGNGFTQNDVIAKTAADADVMSYFAQYILP